MHGCELNSCEPETFLAGAGLDPAASHLSAQALLPGHPGQPAVQTL